MATDTSIQTPAAPQPDARLDKQIADLGGLVSLAMVLVTIFTAARTQAGARRRKAEGLTRTDMAGEAALDLGLLVLTLGVIVATAPIAVDALGRQELGRNAGALRLTVVIVWVLLVALAVWQVAIAGRTLRQSRRVWTRTRKQTT